MPIVFRELDDLPGALFLEVNGLNKGQIGFLLSRVGIIICSYIGNEIENFSQVCDLIAGNGGVNWGVLRTDLIGCLFLQECGQYITGVGKGARGKDILCGDISQCQLS